MEAEKRKSRKGKKRRKEKKDTIKKKMKRIELMIYGETT